VIHASFITGLGEDQSLGIVVGPFSSCTSEDALAYYTTSSTLTMDEKPGDSGVRAHTNVALVVPLAALCAAKPGQAQSLGMPANPSEAQPLGPPFPGFFFETPASLGCIYKLVSPLVKGSDPNVVTAVPTGGSKAIAIVDAYDDPTALSDLKLFSTQFGLTPVSASNFHVIFATGTRPPMDPTGGWELEEALDTEWAHALAPGATVYLVEAASNLLTDLLTAEDVASKTVAAAKGGEVNPNSKITSHADAVIAIVR
jgi:hypothetical protein